MRIAIIWGVMCCGMLQSLAFAQTPADIDGLELWLRADQIETSGADMVWTDLSGNDNGAVQSATESHPAVLSDDAFLNNQPYAFFDGVNDFLFVNSPVSVGAAFVVVNHTDPSGQFPAFDGIITGQGGGNNAVLFIASGGSTNMFNSGLFGNNISVNGATTINFNPIAQWKHVYGFTASSTVLNNLVIGRDRANTTRYWNGGIAEVVIFSSALSPADVEEVYAYFRERYTPEIALQTNYTPSGFCPEELDAGPGFIDYLWNTDEDFQSIEVEESGDYSVSVTSTFNEHLQGSTTVEYPGNFIQSFSLCAGSDSLWSTGLDPLQFDFEWQDGSQNEFFLIQADGVYQVEVTDSEGCSFTSGEVLVSVDDFPALNALEATVQLCEGEQLFTYLSYEEDLVFDWSTGGDESFAVVNTDGIVSVSITNLNGCELNDQTDVTISGVSPLADFSAEYNCNGFEFEFSDLSTSQDENDITIWHWDFGDGTTSDEQNPIHTFSAGGVYIVSLEVETESGCKGVAEQDILVPSEVISELTVSNNCAGFEAEITDQSAMEFGEIVNLSWSVFSNSGTFATGDTPGFSLVFGEEGVYTFQRTYTTDLGCLITLVDDIEILDPAFCFSPDSHSALQLWLAADSLVEVNGNIVNTWGNVVDTENLAEANSPTAPLWVTDIPKLNGKNAVRIPAVNTWMDFGEFSQIRSIVMLIKHESGSQPNFPTIFGHPTATDFVGDSGEPLFRAITASPALINGTGRVNGMQTAVNTISKPAEYSILSFVPTDTLLAQYLSKDRNFGDRGWLGDYVEVLFFDNFLTPAELEQMEQYLRYKYAPPVNLPAEIHVPYGFCDFEISAEKAYFSQYEWSTGGTESTISVSQSGTYAVTVTDIYGYSSSDTVQVFFPGTFLSDDVIICSGDTLIYDTNLPEAGYIFNWSGGQTSSSIAISEQSTVGLTVLDTNGCAFVSPPIQIDVDNFTDELEIQMPDFFCDGNMLSVNFNTIQIANYQWSTGSPFGSIVPEAEGDYWVEVENINGCIGTDTVSIEFNGIAPNTAFALSHFCEQAEVILTNESTTLDGSELTSEEWLVNGELIPGENPPFVFPDFGNYLIELSVSTSANCTGFVRDSVFIHPAPVVGFDYSLPCSGQPVTFEDTSSIALGALSEWLWDFESGNTAILPQTQYTFSSPGVGALSLTVVSDQGCTTVIETSVPVNPTPQASFTWSPTCQGSPMQFQSTTDTSLTGSLNYAWNFDGFANDGITAQHQFNGAGEFSVTHEAWTTISGFPGCFGQSTQMVTVSPQPELDFEHTIACAGDAFTISDLTVPGAGDSIVVRHWFFNGEIIDTTAAFSFTFPDPGEYQVALVIETEAGCSGQFSQTISVGSTEAPSFSLSPEVAGPPAVVQFTNLGSYGAHHMWDFDDGNTSLEIDPEHTYQDSGIYYPQLIVVDFAGCTAVAEGEFYAFDPYFDVSIETVETSIQNGQISVSGVLGNYNNHRLTSAVLRMWLGNGTVVSELWEGNLERNQLTPFAMNAQLNFSDDVNASYLCVEIDLPNGFDLDAVPSNNRKCVSLSAESFEMFSPFPNPADGGFQQFFHLGRSGEIHFWLVQSDGRVVQERTVSFGPGLNSAWFDTRSLASGTYVLWGEFNGETAFKRIQIIR